MYIFSSIEIIILKNPHYKIIIGYDLNVDLKSDIEAAEIIVKFMQNQGLSRCDESYLSQNSAQRFTYCHETLQNFSYIDYFMISNNLQSQVVEFDVIDNAVDMSDHYPIKLN